MPLFCFRCPLDPRLNDVTLLLNSEVTYTSASSGLTTSALAPLSCTPELQPAGGEPATGVSPTQPALPLTCFSAPVDALRA